MELYKTIQVKASSSYDILVGENLLDEAGELIIKTLGRRKLAVLTDSHVDRLYGESLMSALAKSSLEAVKYVFPEGEQSKNAQTLLGFINFMAEQQITRTDAVVALGGGVTGDMAGLAAAVFLRGIPFVQIPTTLLAAVDSSIGGKTAVDIAAGKNLLGAFHQPSLVICDTLLLRTLEPSILRDGFAEVIKHGVILDASYFERLKARGQEPLYSIIARSMEIKRDVVERDEFETGDRKLLNFGHTLGHAIELLSDFTISHGSAVAKGMILAARISREMGIGDVVEDLRLILEDYGFDLECPYPLDQVYKAALSDKKRSGGSITLVLPERIGTCVLRKMPVEELSELLNRI